MVLSVVRRSFILNATFRLKFKSVTFASLNIRKMSNWQVEKQQYLTMSPEDKRKTHKDYIKWSDIPSWKQYAGARKQELAEKIELLPEHSIDSTKNEKLADKVCIVMADITTLEVDAIVNAANTSLLGGGGVDGAIHRAAGPNLKEECRTLKGCDTGDAKITGGYRLLANYVIHTAGPQGEKPDLLKSCYSNCMEVMLKNHLKTIAFPCVSTGIYMYPLRPSAHVAVNVVRKVLEQDGDKVDRVVFCLFNEEDRVVYEGVLQSYFPTK